jgi:mono/diheme cytochrome c family protein
MKRLGLSFGVLIGLASTSLLMSAQNGPSVTTPAPAPAAAATPAGPADARQVFQKYCFECHGTYKPEAGLSIERLLAEGELGPQSEHWEKIADAIETEVMPPVEALEFPTAAERTAAANWVRGSLNAYAEAHAGDPGRVTVRRLTSAEYAYAIEDLTGIPIKVGIDASSDSVGGEGFTNFGDVQFVQDASIERYLEAAKQVANHAVIGSGPMEFFTDPGRTGLELSALARINDLYATRGFRVVSGEGGRPFGLERYGKAFFVAWQFKHRAALGMPRATVRDLAAKEGITGRFADHVWSVVNRPNLGYPSREMVDRWKALPAPTSDVAASLEAARAATDDLSEYLTTWPSWFFARGDLAAGGAGDESPLAFNDETLRVMAQREFTYQLGPRAARGRGAAPAPAGPTKIHLLFSSLNPTPGVKPVVIWRNARVVTRVGGGPGRGGAAVGRGRGPAPALSEQPLRELLPADVAARLAFGTSPDGSPMGPNDFAITGPVTFDVDFPVTQGILAQLIMDAELGADRNGVVRVMLSDRPEGSFRDANTRTIFADAASAGYKTYRAGMAEYASLLPPNSHGEANPADKDPVPAPFDNTYNSPEHDAFVLKVKYQRTDEFFTENMVDGADRDRLEHAWNDLFGSWPYHNAYLDMLADHYKVDLKGMRIADMSPATIASLPEAMRQYVAPLRAHYDRVTAAFKRAENGHLDDVLSFASRAWRRPLTEAEKGRLRAFYQDARAGHELDHDDAVRMVIARILVSPAFLYRLETVADNQAEKPLTGWEMASRLSFFLWSSIPDEELRRAAAAGELSQPARLEAQVRRMVADPKARRIATEFFGQWLGFYRFDEFRGVDRARFPEFTERVQDAMYDEAVVTFDYLVRQNRPLAEMFFADYTFLNKPLADFYGVKAEVPASGEMVKVEGANAFNRGGLLRLGSVLTTTSAPLRTSPVKRGDWILRRILGTPTPPPPADAGSLPSDPAAFGGMTLRERLTEHKRNPTCANCHLRIDPLGFPLERFDAIGRTREVYQDGAAVDDTGEFADRTSIVGAQGLLDYLRSRDGQVMKTFSKKVLGYALGRTVMASDNPLINEMATAGGRASFADLAVRVATSRQFRHHQGAGTNAPEGEVPPAARTSAANRLLPPGAGAR